MTTPKKTTGPSKTPAPKTLLYQNFPRSINYPKFSPAFFSFFGFIPIFCAPPLMVNFISPGNTSHRYGFQSWVLF